MPSWERWARTARDCWISDGEPSTSAFDRGCAVSRVAIGPDLRDYCKRAHPLVCLEAVPYVEHCLRVCPGRRFDRVGLRARSQCKRRIRRTNFALRCLASLDTKVKRLGGHLDGTRKCSLEPCPDLSVICFAQREFCLHHFLSRCYEDLNHFDVRAHGSELGHSVPGDLKALVEECSRCALTVSLQCQNLGNLQRGRLLDILLWANELLLQTGVVVRSTRDPRCARGASCATVGPGPHR